MEQKEAIEAKSSTSKTLSFLMYGIFMITVITQANLQQVLFETYETQMSVQQSFNILTASITTETSDSIDQFWGWATYVRMIMLEAE